MAMTNLTLGFYACAPFFSEMIGDDLLDEQTLATQNKLLRSLFATIITNDLYSFAGKQNSKTRQHPLRLLL